jgi:hypothetical protein
MPKKRIRHHRDTITTERVAIVVMELAMHRNREYTTVEIAQLAQMTTGGAWMMLTKLSRVLPIGQTTRGWMMLDD